MLQSRVRTAIEEERAGEPIPVLSQRYLATRRLTEELAAPLSPEDQAVQAMADASPTKWHLAHTTWFFETFLLKRFAAGYAAYDARFAYLFNSYYEALGARHPRPERGLLTRPSADEVLAYRAYVDAAMRDLLRSGGIEDAAVTSLLTLGIHHEQQHQELILTDILNLFARNPLRPAYQAQGRPVPVPGTAAPLCWVEFAGGEHAIGDDGAGFAFDNEQPRHMVYLPPFRLASRLVSNGEWLTFIADGGYRRPNLWLADGWELVLREGWGMPLYWQREPDGGFSRMTLRGMQPVDPVAPVCHLSYYEADAYARWAGCRLPTEAEWEVAAAGVEPGGNLLAKGALLPLPASPPAAAPALMQMFGDAWEWTASAYLPYPGYRPPAGAVGEYNGKFMCNQMVLRGGSCATPDGHIRASYRNFFYPQQRWQFSGVRLAEDG